MNLRALVIDDDQATCELLRDQLQLHEVDVTWKLGTDEALDQLRDADFDMVIADINIDQMSGIQLCKTITTNRPGTPVIIMTAFGNMTVALEAIHAGASDFVTKPVEMPALDRALTRARQQLALHDRPKRLAEAPAEARRRGSEIIGESRGMLRMYELIRRVASTDTTVLLNGESGTGKELVARALHAESARCSKPFVGLNCAAVPAHLLESELFGHVKGAFTDAKDSRKGLIEQAADGTLLLDEIGEMPRELQPKLLRVLQERRLRPVGGNETIAVTARVIAATNRDLEAEVAARRFREDLYYRLNVVQIQIPPLRDRGADILVLARHFVRKFADRARKAVEGVSDAAAQKLLQYDWPGNVRQLENAMERAVALTHSSKIDLDDLPAHIKNCTGAGHAMAEFNNEYVLSLDELEKRHIQRALRLAKGNKTQTAKALGLDRRTLYRKLERYGSTREIL